VAAIDTSTNTVIATIAIGQQPQALVYVSDAVPSGDGMANLLPLGEAGKAAHLALTAANVGGQSAARGSVSVNAIGPLDLLQAAVSGLKPGQSYTLWLADSRTAPFGQKQALATFKTNLAGAQIVQTVGPLRRVLAPSEREAADPPKERFLMVSETNVDAPELVQAEPTRDD
jgi:hypothetical protein